MRERGFNCGGKDPKLRYVYHDEQNEPRLGHSRSALAAEIVNRWRFDLIGFHFLAS